ncbi:hypothetical protein NDU88_006630, partial [Pleurodeles waltl]
RRLLRSRRRPRRRHWPKHRSRWSRNSRSRSLWSHRSRHRRRAHVPQGEKGH